MKKMSLKKEKWLERIPYILACFFLFLLVTVLFYKDELDDVSIVMVVIIGIGTFRIAKELKEEIIESYNLYTFREYKDMVDNIRHSIMYYLFQTYPKYLSYDDFNSIRELEIDYHNKYLLYFRKALIEYYERQYDGYDDDYSFEEKYISTKICVFYMATLLITSLTTYPVIKSTGLGYNRVVAIFLDKVLENFMAKFEGLGIRKKENVNIEEQLYYALYISEKKRQNYVEMVIESKYSIM